MNTLLWTLCAVVALLVIGAAAGMLWWLARRD